MREDHQKVTRRGPIILSLVATSLVVASLSALAEAGPTDPPGPPPPACVDDDADGSQDVCLDTPGPYEPPQLIQFRVPSSEPTPTGQWEQDLENSFAEGDIYNIRQVEAGPPGGLSTFQGVISAHGLNSFAHGLLFVNDGPTRIQINSMESSTRGNFEVPVIAPVVGYPNPGDPSIRLKADKKKKRLVSVRSRFSFEGRRELQADLTLELEGNTGSDWVDVTEVKATETVTAGQHEIETGPLRARCPGGYRKCRFHAKGELFASADGELWPVEDAESILTKFIIKPKQK